MLKKLIALALCATFSVGMLTACNSVNKKVSKNPKTKSEAHDLAKEVLKEAKDGKNFEKLIEKYGNDPGMTQSPDGYLVVPGQMVQEFEKAAFDLKEGKISDIVTTSYGYHILKRYKIDEDYYKKNKETIDNYYCAKLFNDYLTKLTKDIKPVYATGYDDITLKNVDDFSGANVFSLGDIQVSKELYAYFLKNHAKEKSKGKENYWDDSSKADEFKKVKEDAVNSCLTSLSGEFAAKEKSITLTDDDTTKIDEYVKNIISQMGGDEAYQSALVESFMTEDLYKQLLKYDQLKGKVFQSIYEKGVPEGTDTKDILKFANDSKTSQMVRIKHVLIKFPDENTTSTTAPATTTAPVSTPAETTKAK